MKNYIALFEEFANDPTFGRLYEDQENRRDSDTGPTDYEPRPGEPYIDPSGIDFNNLTKGQQSSVTRGHSLVNNMQFAACYLKAKIDLDPDGARNALGKSTPYEYSYTPTNWEQEYSAKAYAVHMNMNPTTFSKTVTKFRALLRVPEDPYSLVTTKHENRDEAIWPSLVDLFMLFLDTSLDSIKRLACLGYNHEVSSQEKSPEELARLKAASDIRERDLEQLAKDIIRAYRETYKKRTPNDLARAAYKSIIIGIDKNLTEKQKHAKFEQLRKAAISIAKNAKLFEPDFRGFRRAVNPYDNE